MELIITVVSNVLFIIADFSFFFAVPHSTVFFPSVNTFLLNILNSLICPGIALLISFVYRYKQSVIETPKPVLTSSQRALTPKPSFSIDTVCDLLEHETTRNLLKEFCKSEFSVENVLCFEEIIRYQKLTSDEERFRLATSIFETFIEIGSVLEVNITQRVREEVQRSLIPPTPQSLFDKVKDSVGTNLMDSYSRFCHSTAYLAYLSQGRVIK